MQSAKEELIVIGDQQHQLKHFDGKVQQSECESLLFGNAAKKSESSGLPLASALRVSIFAIFHKTKGEKTMSCLMR